MKAMWLAVLASVALTGSAMAQSDSKPAEASIPFVEFGSINNWRADGDRGIYVQDVHRRWYHGMFMGPCMDLPYAETIGFETRGPDRFDRFSTIIVRGQRCHSNSFVKSGPPPKRDKGKKYKIEKVAPPSAG